MKILGDRSPRALAALALTGGLMAGSVFLVTLPDRTPVWLEIVFFILLFGGGVYLLLTSSMELTNGIENQRWSEMQIAPFRSRAASWVVRLLGLTTLVLFSVALLGPRHNVWHEMMWPVFLVWQFASQIMMTLRRPAKASSGALLFTPTIAAPLTSEHWGNR
jgi:hypothetical protein